MVLVLSWIGSARKLHETLSIECRIFHICTWTPALAHPIPLLGNNFACTIVLRDWVLTADKTSAYTNAL